MWEVRTTRVFDEWFAELDEDGQVELIAKVNLLKVLGPHEEGNSMCIPRRIRNAT